MWQSSEMYHSVVWLKQTNRIIVLMKEAVRTSETSVYLKLHGAIPQKVVIFILAAVRT
jgi:hypothetical protein